jgi:sugar/nucleoside kinase (ribokinase family)
MVPVSVSEDSHVDALFVGAVFLDIVLSELGGSPTPGQEVWASRRCISPGGMANNAVGAARLGMRSALVTAVGDDACGDLVWGPLSREARLDLSWARQVAGLETALSVVVSDERDRTLISHGALDPLPLAEITPTLPTADASFFSLRPDPVGWIALEKRAGSMIFAGVGWDERHRWSSEIVSQLSDVDVFVANEAEALAYTGASTTREALRRLGDRVPLAVITLGARGSIALDSAAAVEVAAEPVPGPVCDTTGAGDEFVAGLMHATVAGMPLMDRLRYANLCAGLSTRGWGGAASAPTLDQVNDWYRSPEPKPAGYGFLGQLLDHQRPSAIEQLH